MTERQSLTIAIASSMFFPEIGGTQVHLHNLACELTQRDHTVVVLPAFSQWFQIREHVDSFPYRIVPLPPKQHPLARTLPGFLRLQDKYFAALQRRFNFDIWQSFGTFPAGVSVGHFTERFNVAHVLRTNGSDIQKDAQLGYGMRLKSDLEELIETHATKCDRMLALTESVVPDCVEIGMPRERVEVVPCAVNIERFNSIEADQETIRSRHGLPKDEFVFLCVGRNHPKKGFKYLVEAAELLRDQTDSSFTIAFVGKNMDPLHKQAQRLGVTDCLSFLGEIEPASDNGRYKLPPTEVIQLYKSVDACVFPSLLETFGNVNIESMAAGTPLISTDAPGSRDVVDNEISGLVAEAGNAKSLATQMERIRTVPSLRQQLVEGGRKTIRSKYRWESVVQQYERIYRDLCPD